MQINMMRKIEIIRWLLHVDCDANYMRLDSPVNMPGSPVVTVLLDWHMAARRHGVLRRISDGIVLIKLSKQMAG